MKPREPEVIDMKDVDLLVLLRSNKTAAVHCTIDTDLAAATLRRIADQMEASPNGLTGLPPVIGEGEPVRVGVNRDDLEKVLGLIDASPKAVLCADSIRRLLAALERS